MSSDNENHKDESGYDANDFAYGSANSGFKSYGSDCYDDLLNDEAGYLQGRVWLRRVWLR